MAAPFDEAPVEELETVEEPVEDTTGEPAEEVTDSE